MSTADTVRLLLLAALWGSSFLFMKVAAPAFGPIPLVAVRVGLAALCLAPWLLRARHIPDWRRLLPVLLVAGLLNSGFPFILFAWAALQVPAGLSSIVNATAPLWTALVAWIWLGERLALGRVVGLVVGFAGVVLLVLIRGGLSFDAQTLAVVAMLIATCSYGFAANLTRKHLAGVDPMFLAAATQAAATLLVVPIAAATPMPGEPDLKAWVAACLLAVVCTAVAYALFFRLMQNIGAARAVSVTFLIPAFGMFWGNLLLDEQVTAGMFGACLVIVLGTSLATGFWNPFGNRGASH